MEVKPDILLHQTDITFPVNLLQRLINKVIREENIPIAELRVIFVDDQYLRNLHRDFLNDDTYTDVMTFNLGSEQEIEGEIYISVDRAQVHAREYRIPIGEEIARLIVHGLLHLKGYDDQIPQERIRMRAMENQHLKKNAGIIQKLKSVK